jgi:hypothetical protein
MKTTRGVRSNNTRGCLWRALFRAPDAASVSAIIDEVRPLAASPDGSNLPGANVRDRASDTASDSSVFITDMRRVLSVFGRGPANRRFCPRFQRNNWNTIQAKVSSAPLHYEALDVALRSAGSGRRSIDPKATPSEIASRLLIDLCKQGTSHVKVIFRARSLKRLPCVIIGSPPIQFISVMTCARGRPSRTSTTPFRPLSCFQ